MIQTTQPGTATAQPRPLSHSSQTGKIRNLRMGGGGKRKERKTQIIYKILSDSMSASSRAAAAGSWRGRAKALPCSRSTVPWPLTLAVVLSRADLVLALFHLSLSLFVSLCLYWHKARLKCGHNAVGLRDSILCSLYAGKECSHAPFQLHSCPITRELSTADPDHGVSHLSYQQKRSQLLAWGTEQGFPRNWQPSASSRTAVINKQCKIQ